MSFGSAIGAIVSLRNNKRKAKRKPGNLPGESILNDGVKSHRTPSSKELEHLKKKLQREHKARQVKVIFLSAVFFAIFCAGLYFLLS